MSSQRLSKGVDKTCDLHTIIRLGNTGLGILLERIEPWRERSVLLDVTFHESWEICYTLDGWKEILLFGIVVVMHGLTPALAVREEVPNGILAITRDVRSLEVDGVQASDDAVVRECHLGRDMVCCVGRLCG